jgi:hypothetical protein
VSVSPRFLRLHSFAYTDIVPTGPKLRGELSRDRLIEATYQDARQFSTPARLGRDLCVRTSRSDADEGGMPSCNSENTCAFRLRRRVSSYRANSADRPVAKRPAAAASRCGLPLTRKTRSTSGVLLQLRFFGSLRTPRQGPPTTVRRVCSKDLPNDVLREG